MSKLEKRFETQATAIEMKNYISTKLLPNPALASMIETTAWEGNVLHIKSKIGKGTITLQDRIIDVYFEFTLFGSVAKQALEATLDKEFKQLGGKK